MINWIYDIIAAIVFLILFAHIVLLTIGTIRLGIKAVFKK
jgi:hypothetical protein